MLSLKQRCVIVNIVQNDAHGVSNQSHTGINLAGAFSNALKELGIEDKVSVHHKAKNI